jgi:GR25 family glycosyltransferase involved in LPS biosynthesis
MDNIINLLFMFILAYIAIRIHKKYINNGYNSTVEKYTSDAPSSKTENDWLEDIFDDRDIITIPSRIENVESFAKSFNIKPTIFNATLIKDLSYNNVYNLKMGEIACAISQEAVLKKFINGNGTTLLMLEDDNITFNNDFYKELGLELDEIKQYIKKSVDSLPSGWDVLYFGRCWDDCKKHTPVNEYVVKTRRTLCHHAIAFSRQGARRVLKAIKHPLRVPIDHIVANLAVNKNIDSYATVLPIFYQNRDELSSTIGNFDNLPICA